MFHQQSVKMKELGLTEWLSQSEIYSRHASMIFSDSSPPSRLSVNLKSLSLSPPPVRPQKNFVPSQTTVSKISIEERFLFTKPTEKLLKKKATNLHKKLQARFPNQRNLVVYNFVPYNKKEKRGFFIRYIGDLHVHRSLDNTTTQMVHLEATSDQVHSEVYIKNHSTKYALLKSLDFVHKLHILNRELNESPELQDSYFTDFNSTLHLATIAIVSDLYDEQNHFRESTWKDGLDTQIIRSRLDKLDKLKSFNFVAWAHLTDPRERLNTATGDVLIEIGVHLLLMSQCFTSVWDKLLLRRRCTNVNKATKQVWNQIISEQIAKGTPKNRLTSQFNDAIKARMVEKRRVYENLQTSYEDSGFLVNKKNKTELKSKKKVLKSYCNPKGILAAHRNSALDTHLVITKDDYLSLAHQKPPRPVAVIEDRFVFSTDEDRLKSCDQIQIQELGCSAENVQTKRVNIDQGQLFPHQRTFLYPEPQPSPLVVSAPGDEPPKSGDAPTEGGSVVPPEAARSTEIDTTGDSPKPSEEVSVLPPSMEVGKVEA
eukprot:TRINITY_DN7062_c0_g1_i1.p1 TRINITY_DN7062_c0_g1~~TRINITY_DN7062_c0_g1_i1.p1  ORF type:complete len:541 (-),score=221.52 TRINITY_DN7062_c0_g1_i1:64-1686(-)